MLNLYTTFQHFFAGRTKFPKFKSKKIAKRSYQCPQHCKLDFENGLLNLPKIKNIKTKISRQFNGTIKTVTISKTATGKYFASILVENDETLPTPTTIETDKTMGIDLGLTHFLNFSDGTKIDNPRYLQQAEKQLTKQQKIFSRKKKDNNNYQKQKLAVARIHEKIKSQRIDLTYKITHKLICKNQTTSYVIEDLPVKNMIKNRKLAKAIADVAWGRFVEILSYKAKWYGKNILQVNRFFASSKICSCCGEKQDKLPLSVRFWTCNHCKTEHDRDINASINIKNQGLADALGLSGM